VGGMDVLVNAALKLMGHSVSLGQPSAWANAAQLRIDGLYVAGLWAPPHLASAGGALLLVRWLPLDLRRRPGGCVAAGLVLSGMFYLSPYVTVAAAATMGVRLVLQFSAARRRRLGRHALSLAVCGLLAAALALPYILDLRTADLSGGQPKLAIALPRPSIHPASWLLPGPAGTVLDLATQLLLELMPLLGLGLLGWRLGQAGRRWRFNESVLVVSIPVALLLVLLVRSTGRVNDWGVRVAHVLQLSSAILGGGLMARAGSWGRFKRAGAIALILVGLSASLWQMASANLGRFLVTTPQHRWDLYQAARFIDRNMPTDAVVMFDLEIDGVNYARRWCNRRALLADQIHGSLAYTDQDALRRVEAACQAVRDNGLGPEQVRMLRQFGASAALVPADLLGGAFERDRLAYSNKTFAVAGLD